MTRWRVISRSHIWCISFKSSSSLSSFECLVSSWAISLTQVFFWVWAFFWAQAFFRFSSLWAWASFSSASTHIVCICSYSWVLCFFDFPSHSSSMSLNVWAICRSFKSNVCSSCFLVFEEKIISWLKLIDAFIFSSLKLFINAFIVAEMNVSLSVVSSLLYSISWKWYSYVELQCWEIKYRCNIESFEINRMSTNTCNDWFSR